MFQVLGLFFEMENVSSNIEDWCGGPGHNNVNIIPIMNGYVLSSFFPFIVLNGYPGFLWAIKCLCSIYTMFSESQLSIFGLYALQSLSLSFPLVLRAPC